MCGPWVFGLRAVLLSVRGVSLHYTDALPKFRMCDHTT